MMNIHSLSKRLFLGIPLPSRERDELFTSIEPLIKLYPMLRWVRKENYHITVSFFGEVDAQDIPQLQERIDSVLSIKKSFSLCIERLEFAPKLFPRMIWAVGEQSDFTTLVSEVETVVEDNILPDSRQQNQPIPHIILARFDKRSEVTAIALPDLKLTIPVTSCILFQSELSQKGPRYRPVREFQLS